MGPEGLLDIPEVVIDMTTEGISSNPEGSPIH